MKLNLLCLFSSLTYCEPRGEQEQKRSKRVGGKSLTSAWMFGTDPLEPFSAMAQLELFGELGPEPGALLHIEDTETHRFQQSHFSCIGRKYRWWFHNILWLTEPILMHQQDVKLFPSSKLFYINSTEVTQYPRVHYLCLKIFTLVMWRQRSVIHSPFKHTSGADIVSELHLPYKLSVLWSWMQTYTKPFYFY